MEYEVTATVMNQITNQPIMNGSTPVSKTVVVKTKEDGTIEYVKVKDTDTTLEYKVTAKRTNTYDITIDIPIVFNSIGANGSSIVLFEDLKHNNVIVKSHHELEDTDEQIHYFELILYKEGLDNPTIAEFKIEQNNTQMKFKALTDGSYAIASDGTLTTLHPNTKGVIVIRGFNADPYTITEIKTASGKNMLTQPVNVQFISDTSDADNIIRGLKVSMKDEKGREYTAIINPTDETKPYSIELNVTNNDSIKLMTGGHGTYMFYFFGLTLLIFAMGIFMIYRRKRH
jgi:LPXTG-motif cell wall-anchored protein